MIERDNVRICVPRFMQIGKGSLNQLPEIIKTLDPIKSFLIVTDKQMVEFGYVKKLQDILNKAGLKSNVFDDTVPDPTDTVVLNGINHVEKFNLFSIIISLFNISVTSMISSGIIDFIKDSMISWRSPGFS